ncbi:LpxL/LpxP family Kdo(2)-lipid IV(A) lauroyl/palmitoleoyl acyltransferase [Dokdonella koreensis]|uniref:LpxL/LpxP family Kdo(2)-lipid IV(A) lauroyl/palmitoleoyl acyltransferase n=1 Tax=Dokdonella koreensis TaxID=323415 RepID=UPI0008306AF4|nr:LpxL/LpxP family Kdo(2)-lipid IV(A) lauroyl/palmitoleoyl acyltransferase [Dokdonella koreensis]
MSVPSVSPVSSLVHPRHWLSWLGVGAIAVMARLPYRLLLVLGGAAGWLAARLLRSRRRVAERNLALCFPELGAAERAALLEENLRDTGRMLAEFALAWMGTDRALARVPMTLDGLEHLEAAHRAGRGVLLVGAHFSHLELCARLVSQRLRIAGMYRVMDNPVFERAVLRARLRYAVTMFTKEEIRQTVRHLRDGGAIWYAPDQDMRGKDSVFVPFFGIPASTITATHHLARLGQAAVIPFFHRRLPGGGYALRLEAPLADFPSDDPVADTARVNAAIERMVREAPSQYLWIHKRFKTRPPGAPPVY